MVGALEPPSVPRPRSASGGGSGDEAHRPVEDLPADVQATYCATLVDEWVQLGVSHAVVSPGSRSTPMALALAERDDISVHVVHDERSAAFVALGIGVESGASSEAAATPALVLCTSGTAAANFYPAVVEAGLSNVPLIVLTADRPQELRGVGAPQTIDQIELYGDHVRWFADPGVPESDGRAGWRQIAADAHRHAVAGRRGATNAHLVGDKSPEPGPVQLNLAFREPLLGQVGAVPARNAEQQIAAGALRSASHWRPVDLVPSSFECQRGVILAGGRSGVGPDEVAALRELTDWPILADPASGMRHLDGVVTTAESLLRHARFAADHAPDVIVRIGRPATSKTLSRWVQQAVTVGSTLIQVGGPGRIDPDHNVAAVCAIGDLLAAQPRGASGTTWAARWAHAERTAQDAVVLVLADLAAAGELTEPGVAQSVAEHLPSDVALTVASSMPVRDLEWFGGARAVAHCNRGANGIDGVTSTALGRAMAGTPSAVLIGDLAFVHDSSALIGLRGRNVDLRIIVVDNDGGGIFSFLPQASELDEHRFEQLFGTPLGVDVVGLAAAHGVDACTVSTSDELIDRLQRPGPWVARVASNRRRNVEVHNMLHAAVVDALGS